MSGLVIDADLQELQESLGQHKLSQYQINMVRDAMANYALAATMDSSVEKEAVTIAVNSSKEIKNS